MNILDRKFVTYIVFPTPHGETPPSRFNKFSGLKDAPYFQPVDIGIRTLGEESPVEACRSRSCVNVTMIVSRSWIVRFRTKGSLRCMRIQQRAKFEKNLKANSADRTSQNGLYEEYTMLLVKEAKPRQINS